MLELDPNKPTRYVADDEGISPEMFRLFFKHMAPDELKYRLYFAGLLASGSRPSEGTAINCLDFLQKFNWEKYKDWIPAHVIALLYPENKERLLDFLKDLKQQHFETFKMRLCKNPSMNMIVDMEYPLSYSCLLEEYIWDHIIDIITHGGFVFHKPNMKPPIHIEYVHVQNFLTKKRKLLQQLYPDKGFGDVLRTVEYKDPWGFSTTTTQKLYRFRPHGFRKNHALLAYTFEDRHDVEFAKQELHHKRSRTTSENYIKDWNFINKRRAFLNATYNADFHDMIRQPGSEAVAVWHGLKKYDH